MLPNTHSIALTSTVDYKLILKIIIFKDEALTAGIIFSTTGC